MSDATTMDASFRGNDRAAEFARARRHTRMVHFLRRAIPIGCVLAVAVPLVLVFYNPFRLVNANVSVGRISMSGDKITMEAPKLTGFKKDGRAYVVNASSAAQDPRHPSIVELHELVADIQMPSNGWAKLKSQFGVYDSQNEKLDLRRTVHLRTDTGYDITTASAKIDFKNGSVIAPDPVKVAMTTGTITGDSMEIRDNGKEILFKGHVVSQFQNLGGDTPAATESQKP